MSFPKELAGKYLVENWTDGWKFASVWVYVVIGCAPELYNLALTYGMVEGTLPEMFSKVVSMLAFLGAASRLLKQKSLEHKQSGGDDDGANGNSVGHPDKPTRGEELMENIETKA